MQTIMAIAFARFFLALAAAASIGSVPDGGTGSVVAVLAGKTGHAILLVDRSAAAEATAVARTRIDVVEIHEKTKERKCLYSITESTKATVVAEAFSLYEGDRVSITMSAAGDGRFGNNRRFRSEVRDVRNNRVIWDNSKEDREFLVAPIPSKSGQFVLTRHAVTDHPVLCACGEGLGGPDTAIVLPAGQREWAAAPHPLKDGFLLVASDRTGKDSKLLFVSNIGESSQITTLHLNARSVKTAAQSPNVLIRCVPEATQKGASWIVYNLTSNKITLFNAEVPMPDAALTQGGERVAVMHERGIWLYDLTRGRPHWIMGDAPFDVARMAFSESNLFLASGDGEVAVVPYLFGQQPVDDAPVSPAAGGAP